MYVDEPYIILSSYVLDEPYIIQSSYVLSRTIIQSYVSGLYIQKSYVWMSRISYRVVM